MNVRLTPLQGLLIIEPLLFGDHRGFFTETYHEARYRHAGISCVFVQDNLSYSIKNTLRGLHFQIHHPQAKLVQVISGEVYDVAVDLRRNSATFGKWEGVYLSSENMRQLFIPEGFAHGFCVLSDTAIFSYKCSDFYTPGDEGGVIWSDSEIGIPWPVTTPIISEKDQCYPLLKDLSPDRLPEIRG
ncbi:MAG: dTDP-4-dehydrorhamnose 3,5-epimerase [Desulfobacterales bacterium]|jgi:dTDP-4-dehydrorhamnose 3,5-epimerase|nr:dTDP-4-dehydrorhamnose 3,5-epimerase [Desulfobacterales bacterium]